MKNNPWFRMYHEFATDPKVQMLSEADQRRFVMLLCLRCCNGDVTLHDDEVTFQLRISADEWSATKSVLTSKNLIDENNHPTAWDRRQYVSDQSNSRVQKYREKRKAAGLPQQQWFNQTTKSEIMKKNGGSCVYCHTTENITVDHMVPLQRGGTDEIDNLQPACRSCNADKRNMTHDEYMAWDGRVTLQKRRQSKDTEEDTDTEVSKSPLPPEGASDDMPKHVKPVSDWSKAFSAEPEHETVRIEAGAVVLVNGTRAEWLARFGGDAEGLDLALIQVAGQIQPNSRSHSVEQQANRHLARIVQERRDRDRRYRDVAAQNAAKGNAKPTKRTLSDVLREQAEGVSK